MNGWARVFLLAAFSLAGSGCLAAWPQGEVPEGQVEIEEIFKQRVELVHMVKPSYPVEARRKGVQGLVSIDVTINRQGQVARANVASGPVELRQPALAAVRQWRYKPVDADVQATININYRLPKTGKRKS